MNVELSSSELQTGLVATKGKPADKDRFIGKLRPLDSASGSDDGGDAVHGARKTGKPVSNSDDVRLACSSSYCVAAWNDASGMQAAYLDPRSSEIVWQHGFGKRGVHGTVSTTNDDAVVVWYEATQVQEVSRVQMISAGRSGLGKPSTIAKVSGRDIQPYAEVSPSKSPHQWYVAWRDYEAGHLEAMLARVDCQSVSP